MRLPPRRYQAMGAAIVAGAVTARYVAKWRRRRLRRLGEQRDKETGINKAYVGVSFVDTPLGPKTSCSIATLDNQLRCHFSTWDLREDGLGILPNSALGKPFLLAIAGPQGLAAEVNSVARECEQKTHSSLKTPYSVDGLNTTEATLCKSSIALYHNLVSSGARFRLLGLNDTSVGESNLIEVCPEIAWRSTARAPLAARNSLEGRRMRAEVLQNAGVDFISGPLITEAQLDSAICAWTALCLDKGKVHLIGKAPFEIPEQKVFREGFMIQPDIDAISSELDSASFAPV
ncbi:MAG: hypothetical protein CL776_04820 [Chloroflexi bacterium]|nr:hypothetical protein [Chloroflexota bacterium]